MANGSYLKTVAYNLIDEIGNAQKYLAGEVNGGNWDDRVGESYLKYIQQIEKNVDSMKNTAEDIYKVEMALENCDTSKDELMVKSLEASVNSL